MKYLSRESFSFGGGGKYSANYDDAFKDRKPATCTKCGSSGGKMRAAFKAGGVVEYTHTADCKKP